MVKTDDSLYGLAADGCNCNQFYQCDLNATTGSFYIYSLYNANIHVFIILNKYLKIIR